MTPRIVVRLNMKSEAQGGRPAAFTEGYRPHFVVPPSDVFLSVTASCCPGPVAPGDQADVAFVLDYHPKLDYSALRVGAEFEMREGPKVVAVGRVERWLSQVA